MRVVKAGLLVIYTNIGLCGQIWGCGVDTTWPWRGYKTKIAYPSYSIPHIWPRLLP